ncbi:NAD(P)H-hydrate dehydratase [bacterium]|nr:NAD(P)H-hydrate dehydratase [bacterium]
MQTQLKLPSSSLHKGQNGKLLIIGGSRLFHAASLWSAGAAAHLVDMVFYASTSENNNFVKTAKANFADGIVVERENVWDYAREADVILLGPGLARGEPKTQLLQTLLASEQTLTSEQWQDDTYLVTNWLLARLPEKKYVLDAGALQMLETQYLTPRCILTPHQLELEVLIHNARERGQMDKLNQATILSKNIVDEVWRDGRVQARISGGNEGLTKGGSGDVLAGVVAGLYCYNDTLTACEWASQTIKTTGDILYRDWGPFYTTTQLCERVGKTLWELYRA